MNDETKSKGKKERSGGDATKEWGGKGRGMNG